MSLYSWEQENRQAALKALEIAKKQEQEKNKKL